MPPLKVFVVEDSATIRQNLVAALEEWAPVQVVGHADSAGDAIDHLLQSPPPCDLAILDVMLRQGSGIDVLNALRKAASPLRRVVLTNYATPLIRDHCLSLGADRVFDKSGEVDALLDYCGALAAAPGGA
ncbi:MAG: response regulator [Rubrivivax sp.]